jgi:hypothetical protein
VLQRVPAEQLPAQRVQALAQRLARALVLAQRAEPSVLQRVPAEQLPVQRVLALA